MSYVPPPGDAIVVSWRGTDAYNAPAGDQIALSWVPPSSPMFGELSILAQHTVGTSARVLPAPLFGDLRLVASQIPASEARVAADPLFGALAVVASVAPSARVFSDALFGECRALVLASPVAATGGDVSQVQIGTAWYAVHRFTTDGAFVVDAGPGWIEALIVGGGGGGGGTRDSTHSTTGGEGGGGGGAGQVRIVPVWVETDDVLQAEIGDGGAGGPDHETPAGDGAYTRFGDEYAGGGGGGARGSLAGDYVGSVGGGGSTGGGSYELALGGSLGPGVEGANRGGRGGDLSGSYPAGGGGGAAGPGGPGGSSVNGLGHVGGAGGPGLSAGFVGAPLYLGGGGGGGIRTYAGATAGAGGIGGGGDAGSNSGGNGMPGEANTGGGGGGACMGDVLSTLRAGGDGGSGVVYVRYLLRAPEAGAQVRAGDFFGNLSSHALAYPHRAAIIPGGIMRYYCRLTGTPDLLLPISSFSVRHRADTASYYSIVIPSFDGVDAIAERALGQIVLWTDTDGVEEELFRGSLGDVRTDRGAKSQSITISGRASQAAMPTATYVLTDVLYAYSTFDGEQRLRIPPRAAMRPGDTVQYLDTLFTVGLVSWSVGAENAMMEIALAGQL